jgi:hypothetical protein
MELKRFVFHRSTPSRRICSRSAGVDRFSIDHVHVLTEQFFQRLLDAMRSSSERS